MLSRSLIGFMLLWLVSAPCSSRAADTRVYELQHTQGQTLEQPVRELLDEHARVSSLRNQLIVVAEPDQQALAEGLIRQLDRPSRMLRVSIDQSRVEQRRGSFYSASGRLGVGEMVLTTGQPPQPSGNIEVRGRSGDDRIRLGAQSETKTQSHSASQHLAVMEGHWGMIRVGQKVPVTEQLLLLCRRYHGEVVELVNYQEVDTGFEVLPHVYGDMVEVNIRPFLAFQEGGNSDRIVFQDLSTRMRLQLGTWYDLGGFMSVQDDVSREIMSLSKQSLESGGTIRVKVDPQPY